MKVEGNRPQGEDRILDTYVSAAKEAVRLSGTEFVLEDRDLHKRVDMTWTLESIHDGALRLTSRLDSAFRQSEETFSISFVDSHDLPRRIADLARSRLRRIRYVWPYEQKYPAVLRDLDFTPDPRVLVQKISWMDPARNEYEEDTPFSARIENNTNFSKLQLSDEIKFPRSPDGSFNFDPMSNIAYRVIIAREPHASWIWVVLPYALHRLVRARLRRAGDRPAPAAAAAHRAAPDLSADGRGLPPAVARSRRSKRARSSGAIPKYMDEFVKELKTAGSFLDVVRAGGFDFNFGPLPVRFSILMKLGSHLWRRRPQLSSELFESSGAGSVAALDTLIQFLVCRRRLSPFVGLAGRRRRRSQPPAWPIEWEALNDIASRHFQKLGICDKRVDANLGTQHSVLSAVVSTHFRGVIKKATHDASLFRQTWTVREQGTPARLDYEGEMGTPLVLRNQNGAAPATRVRVEVHLPSGAVLSGTSADTTLRAWVFGKILNWSVEQGIVSLQIRPIAILRDYAHQH